MVKKIRLTDSSKSCSAKGNDLRTHFKNTFHVGRAIKGMLINKAEAYLHDVLEHKRCIPFSRFDHSVGRCSAAIQFGLTKGRWPEKSIRYVLNLIQNARSNAEAKKLNISKLIIKNVFVNQAAKGRRRTYRAHGSINAYLSCNCHVELICEELKEKVKKEQKQKEIKGKLITPRIVIRKALAKKLGATKFVEVGKKLQKK